MIKAIIFDFDGVLLESAEIKTIAFRRLFSRWPDKVDEIIDYHIRNMGISRYVKFKYFYENILGQKYLEEVGLKMGEEFSQLVLEEIANTGLVPGAKEFLNNNSGKYLFFIASGTPQEELDDVVASKGLTKYFKGIFGSPSTKSTIVNNIFAEYSLLPKEAVFVGDAESDMKAAKETGVAFILRSRADNAVIAKDNKINISDMTLLDRALSELEENHEYKI